jgi:hypothetical protein
VFEISRYILQVSYVKRNQWSVSFLMCLGCVNRQIMHYSIVIQKCTNYFSILSHPCRASNCGPIGRMTSRLTNPAYAAISCLVGLSLLKVGSIKKLNWNQLKRNNFLELLRKLHIQTLKWD